MSMQQGGGLVTGCRGANARSGRSDQVWLLLEVLDHTAGRPHCTTGGVTIKIPAAAAIARPHCTTGVNHTVQPGRPYCTTARPHCTTGGVTIKIPNAAAAAASARPHCTTRSTTLYNRSSTLYTRYNQVDLHTVQQG